MKYAIFVLSLLISFGVSANPEFYQSNQQSGKQIHVPFSTDTDDESFISTNGTDIAIPTEGGVRSAGAVVDVDFICATLPGPLAALGLGDEIVIDSTMVDTSQPGNRCLIQDVNTVGTYHYHWEAKHIRIESPFEASHGLCRFRASLKCALDDFLSLE